MLNVHKVHPLSCILNAKLLFFENILKMCFLLIHLSTLFRCCFALLGKDIECTNKYVYNGFNLIILVYSDVKIDLLIVFPLFL